MATETETKVGEQEAPKQTFKATLTNGETYYLGNRRFDKGKAGLVTDVEKALLEEAEYSETVLGPNGEATSRPVKQFEFKAIGEGDDEDETEEETAPARTRSRAKSKAA